MTKLTESQKRRIYNNVMTECSKALNKILNELSVQTIKDAADKSATKNLAILKTDPYGNTEVDPEKFEKWLSTLPTEAQRRRYQRLYDEGKLVEYLVRQKHILSTHSHSNMEWFRENTDISLSPEFFSQENGYNQKSYSQSSRKPTEDEHNFYRFFTSMGTDTEGMSENDIERYREAWIDYYKATIGIDPTQI